MELTAFDECRSDFGNGLSKPHTQSRNNAPATMKISNMFWIK
jgi:hypothetical protein